MVGDDQAWMVVAGLLILAVLVAVVLPLSQKAAAQADPFVGTSGIPAIDNARRSDYIEMGRARYNKFADTNDVTRGNFMRATTPTARADGDAALESVTQTAELTPDASTGTRLGVTVEKTKYRLPPSSLIDVNVEKCEALKGRAVSCAALGTAEYANCGVCIDGGTTYGEPVVEGRHIGGLLSLPEDRTGSTGVPSVGSCPADKFFVARAACVEAADRADCAEFGANGGFRGGKTAEGADVSAKCSQVPDAGIDAYVYDTKGRKFNVGLRVLTPRGTGICKVWVRNTRGEIIGYRMSDTPGTSFVVPIMNVTEGDRFAIVVALEAPQRAADGKSEVFQYKVNPTGNNDPQWSLDEVGAETACERIGTRIATEAELRGAQALGAQVCSVAWARGFLGWIMQANEKRGSCGPGAGTHRGTFSNGRGYAWCYGVKPPQSTNQNFFTQVIEWFVSLGNTTDPSQENMPNQKSKYGDYQAPFNRAILIQWESLDGRRTAKFEPSLLSINGIAADDAGNIRVMRRFGTFASSTTITAPKPALLGEKMLTDANWFWSNIPVSQTINLSAFVPGTFLDPVYPADAAKYPSGPLITKKETMEKLRTSPCLVAGQAAGAYSYACLRSLFVGAGGDPINGKLAANLVALNNRGSAEKISEFLTNRYRIATTGRSAGGMPATAVEINAAAQDMFGIELVSPCEDIVENEMGLIGFVPKRGAVDAECLDWLWRNTGTDKDRGEYDAGRRTTIAATYVSIGDRFSGLRNGEGTAAARAAAPFRTCTPDGALAPKKRDGSVNYAAVNAANARGSIAAIQDFYNGIYKSANYDGGRTDISGGHARALNQCYGIVRAADAAPPVCPPAVVSLNGLVRPGARFSFVTNGGAYLRHAGFALFANDPRAIPADGAWDIVAGNSGDSDTISFKSVNFPDRFIRHSGFRCWLHRRDGSRLFDLDSTFRIVAGVSGSAEHISFQSVNFPAYYLAVHQSNPQEVWITTVRDNSASDKLRACWITKPSLIPRI